MNSREPPNCELSTAALAELGLERQPFVAPTRDDLYSDPGLQSLIERLLHNLTYGDMLLLLLGAGGSGKTSLVLALLDHLPGRLELFIAKGQIGLSSERIVRDMLATIDPDESQDFSTALSQLFDHLSTAARNNVPAALVVDDADLIEPRQLERLLELVERLNQALDAPLHLMLVGRPALESTLAETDARVIREGRVFTTQVRPLSSEQARDLVTNRLQFAGGDGTLPLNENQWDSLFAASGGNPALLQAQIAEQLNTRHLGASSARKPVRQGSDLKIWPAAALLAAVLALLVVWMLRDSDRPQPDERVELTIPQRPGRPAPTEATSDAPRPTPAPVTAGSGNPETAGTRTTAIPSPDRIIVAPEAPNNPTAQAVTSTPTDARRPDSGTAITQGDSASARTERDVSAAPSTALASASNPPGPGTDTAESVTDRGQPPPASAPPAFLHGPDWLRRQDADAYTLQVLALGQRETVIEFATAQKLDRSTPAAMFRTRHQGGDWFVLVSGVYPDRNSARAALRALPRPVRRNGPWMRSFASIQEALDDTP